MNIQMEGMEMNVCTDSWHKGNSKVRIDSSDKNTDFETFEKHVQWRKIKPYLTYQVLQTITVIKERNCMICGKIR